MDTIFIEKLAVRGKHGVSQEERLREQEFLVDIEVEFDTRKAAGSDDLSDTIDYNFFRDNAQEIVGGQSFRLLEKLADAIAQKILTDVRIKTVSVSVRKTEMFPDCTPGVKVVRIQ